MEFNIQVIYIDNNKIKNEIFLVINIYKLHVNGVEMKWNIV